MGLLEWLGLRPSRQIEKGQTSPRDDTRAPKTSEPAEQEIFKSPALLAGWVEKFILSSRPIESDFGLLPDDAARQDLNVTVAQRERCLREYSVLRMAGVATLVKQQYSDAFYLAFCRSLMPHLFAHIYGPSSAANPDDDAQAIDTYVALTISQDVDGCAALYLKRVYDDSDHFSRIKFAGIGFISVHMINDAHEVFRDAHCQVTQGMSYKSYKLISDAIEKVKEQHPEAP
jgi:hypothetical protein